MFVHCYQNSYLVVFFNYKATIQVSNQFSKPYTCIMKKDIKIQVWTEGPAVIRTNNISLHCTCNKSVVNVVINEPYIAWVSQQSRDSYTMKYPRGPREALWFEVDTLCEDYV